MAPALALCLTALAFVGALPFTFFRPGRPTFGWLLTASPFFMDAAFVLAALTGLIAPSALPARWMDVLAIAAVPLLAAAIALISLTAGVHDVPVSLWHQQDDMPDRLVTRGPYARVRHPFYAAFTLVPAGCAAALPHPATSAVLVAGTFQLYRTARREERRLLVSPLGAAYARYMRRTGRFVPRLSPNRRDAATRSATGA